MKLRNREDRADRRVRLTIQVEQAEWQEALQEVYRKNSMLYPVKDVEQGQATRQQLEEAYGQDFLYQEALNESFPRALIAAVESENIALAGRPELEMMNIGPEGYTFTALIDLYPEVTLGQYKGLSAPWTADEPSEAELAAAESAYLRAHPLETEVDRAADGDEVVLDFEGFVDGVAFDGGKAEQYPLTLGSGSFIPGFEEQVVGIAPGEEREIAVTFPQQYTPELAGKDATFRIKAHRIVRRAAAGMDGDYAKSQGFADVEALRRHIARQAAEDKNAQAQGDFTDAIMAKLVANMEADIPASMVEGRIDSMLAELENQLMTQGVTLDTYLEAMKTDRDTLRAQARPNALEGVRQDLALTEVARLENITVSDEELSAQYGQMAALYGMDAGELEQQLSRVELRNNLQMSRARKLVLESAIRE
jgi:trigger factor